MQHASPLGIRMFLMLDILLYSKKKIKRRQIATDRVNIEEIKCQFDLMRLLGAMRVLFEIFMGW